MKYSELKKLLKKDGCIFRYEGKRHEMWFSPKTGNEFPVGRHNSQGVAPELLKRL